MPSRTGNMASCYKNGKYAPFLNDKLYAGV